jgi:hypothetical protein
MRHLRILALVATVGFVANCGGGGGGGGGGPEPGFLNLTLSTPNANDGAVLFRVVGGTVEDVLAGAMVQDGSFTIQPSLTRIVVAGNIVDGVVAQIEVPDIADVANYSVVMEQATIRTAPWTQQSLTGYSIAVSVAP